MSFSIPANEITPALFYRVDVTAAQEQHQVIINKLSLWQEEDVMVQHRCARGFLLALLGLACLALPPTARSQAPRGGANSSLVGEIKGLVDIIAQAMQQEAPNREMNHLNQALHQLLMALEGGFGQGHHGKKHHHH